MIMKCMTAAVIAAALLLLPATTCAGDTDKEQVVEALRTMMAATSAEDMARIREVTTPGFYIFDMGHDMTAEQLVGMVRDRRESGVTFNWQVTEPRVNIDGHTAWVTYVNPGAIARGAKTKEMAWLESAVLRRIDGSWRIVFLHSTPVAEPGD